MVTLRSQIRRATLLVAGILLSTLAGAPAAALDRSGWIRRVVERINAPSPRLDSAYIYQPKPRWNVTLSNDLRRTGMSQSSAFEAHGVPTNLYCELWERLYKGVGIHAGYGSLTLGMSREVGRKSADYNKSFSLNYMGAGLGLHASYYDIRQPMAYTLTTGTPGSADYSSESGTSDYPGRMKMITVEGIYAFNHSTFSYGSVYKGNKIQRRSAGSWLIGAKFVQGEVKIDPAEPISDLLYGLCRQSTLQASVGAGYSYNFVPYHRQPAGAGTKGFRNFSINLTGMPLLTVLDRHYSTRYVYNPLTGSLDSQEKRPLGSTIRLNFVARGALAYSWDRFYLSLAGTYDHFSYRGTTKIVAPALAADIKTAGHFSKWSTVLTFNVKF